MTPGDGQTSDARPLKAYAGDQILEGQLRRVGLEIPIGLVRARFLREILAGQGPRQVIEEVIGTLDGGLVSLEEAQGLVGSLLALWNHLVLEERAHRRC